MNTTNNVDAVVLEIFRQLFSALAEEMGAILGRTASSPNIKERKDYSCALFNHRGELIAQAAHIPVHLGAMPLSVQTALQAFDDLEPGDVIILNDPYCGGTHLPDITLISPLFWKGELVFIVANRAHHADVGGIAPGSMPLAREIYQEGLIIPPTRLIKRGEKNTDIWNIIRANVRTPEEREADLLAQVAANEMGKRRLKEMIERYGVSFLHDVCDALLNYAERMMRLRISRLPEGTYRFTDYMDDDGFARKDIAVRVSLTVKGDTAVVDFTGSDPQCTGSINAVYAVTLSAVRYVFRCLLDIDAPTNEGLYRPIHVIAPEGTVVHAVKPSAVSSGNVELSQRIVDAVLGALAEAIPEEIPAASAGTMNNVTFGGIRDGKPFTFYETLGGGAGASPRGPGASGIQTHMTNTMNTPIEVIEKGYPVRIHQYRLRRNSGGRGKHRGGDGLIREYEFLVPMQVSIMSDRRRRGPYGLHGGEPGKPGLNLMIKKDGQEVVLPGKFTLSVDEGTRLRIETPGGGGWSRPEGDGSDDMPGT